MKNLFTLAEIISSFNRAVVDFENVNDDGSINWSFVDADIYLDAARMDKEVPENYFELFNDLADKFEAGFAAIANTDLNVDPTRPAYIKETL